jgi:hypothetical protein
MYKIEIWLNSHGCEIYEVDAIFPLERTDTYLEFADKAGGKHWYDIKDVASYHIYKVTE